MNRTARQKFFMRFLLPISAAAAVLVLAVSLHSSEPTDPLAPSKEMASQTRWVVNTINARHYLRDTMEKLDGTEMVEAYIESFDYSRMYFLQSDLEDFNFRFAESMENFLEKGNLYAAFEIYDSFKQIAESRTDWVFSHLQEDWDFSSDANFAPDRREAEWPASKKEADDLWERRLKYELLNELLSLASETKEEDFEEKEGTNLADSDGEEDEEKFDPTKLQRLLENEDFLAETLDEAREKIRRRYERNLSHTIDREAAEVQEAYINAMTQLFDPHSTFLSSDTLESFNSTVQNSFVGIGAMLEDVDGICTIKELLPGGPAEESRQLEPKDEILGVAQGELDFEDVVDMELRYIVRKIKGEKGTTVRLLIRPGDAADPSVRKIVPIVRDEVKLTANLAEAKLITVPTESGETIPVGVIELPSFYGNIGAGNTLTTTSGDVTELLNKLRDKGAQGIILDLRSNGGGLLSEAVRVAGLFIPDGPIVQVRDKDGKTDILFDRDLRLVWDGPLIVLTSRFSASASEIVAGALQDHDRALIVGNSSTHGKGTVQEVYHMNTRMPFGWFQTTEQTRPVASKITIKQFYLPDGSSTQVKGVPSDIALPSVNEFLPIGEDDLPHALPWDSIAAVDWVTDWKKLEMSSPKDTDLVEFLIDQNKSRLKELPEFHFLKEQISWRQERFDEKIISLNLADRIQRKIDEQSYVDELDDTYDEISENRYESEEVLLAIVEEQNALSKKNLAKPVEAGDYEKKNDVQESPSEKSEIASSDEAKKDESEEEDEPPFDIYLRETARIIADWIQFVDA